MRMSKKFLESNREDIEDFKRGRKKIDSQLILEDVKRVIEERNGDTRINTYRKHGTFSSSTVMRSFGNSWINVISAVGITCDTPKFSIEPKPAETSNYKLRSCLGKNCNETFMSWGPDNRICSKCKSSDSWINPPQDLYQMSHISHHISEGVADVSGY